eukprot:625321-Rhodomonas_salina.1
MLLHAEARGVVCPILAIVNSGVVACNRFRVCCAEASELSTCCWVSGAVKTGVPDADAKESTTKGTTTKQASQVRVVQPNDHSPATTVRLVLLRSVAHTHTSVLWWRTRLSRETFTARVRTGTVNFGRYPGTPYHDASGL